MMDLFKSRRSSVGKEVIDSKKFEKELNDWKLPTIPTHKIYKEGMFSRRTNYAIETMEKTVSLSKENETIRLLSRWFVAKFRGNYDYLHFGLVQVAVKPNPKEALDAPIFMCLRDARLLKFDQSLLAMVESKFCNGPIYFNCYPSYCVALADAMNTLTLNIKTQAATNSVPVTLTYRVHCKAMRHHSGSKAINELSREGTPFYQVDLLRRGIAIPNVVDWNEINVPNILELQDATDSRETARSSNVSGAEIVRLLDGRVQITLSPPSRKQNRLDPESRPTDSQETVRNSSVPGVELVRLPDGSVQIKFS